MFTHFQASDRAGPDIVFSLIADLALLEGEAMRRIDPELDWGIDRNQRTYSFKRPCLTRSRRPGEDWTFAQEFEYTMVDYFYDRANGKLPLRFFGKHLSHYALKKQTQKT